MLKAHIELGGSTCGKSQHGAVSRAASAARRLQKLMQTNRRRNETETHRGRVWPALEIHGRCSGGWGIDVGRWTLVGSLEWHGTGDGRGRGNPHGATCNRRGCRWSRVRIFLRAAAGEPE